MSAPNLYFQFLNIFTRAQKRRLEDCICYGLGDTGHENLVTFMFQLFGRRQIEGWTPKKQKNKKDKRKKLTTKERERERERERDN